VLALGLLAPVPANADSRPDPTGPSAGPSHAPRLLSRAGHGRAVIEELGDRLPRAATVNRMSPAALRAVLDRDPSAWLGEDGQLYYVEKAEALPGTGLLPGAATAVYPESQTFALHSLPGSAHTIFLDFDGASVTNTWWNTNAGHMPARSYTGFTLDADPATFTSAEKAYIQQVWRIVAEKYAAFDVNVTTQDLGPAAYNRSGTLDQTYGDHVVITDDPGAATSACNATCSGVALLGRFDDGSDSGGYLEPAWVFSSMTSHSAVLTAHTVAHEVGHTFDLGHDGDATNEYSLGHDNWFPLMGSGVRGVGQFSRGEYAGANNQQDDLLTIATHGAPFRVDDRSDVPVGAEPIATGGVAQGVIGTGADRDVFAVDHDCTTNLTARATGVGAGASLDIRLSVLDALGREIASADPPSWQTNTWPALPTGMDAQLTVAAGDGLYFVRVEGVGKPDPVRGYPGYGSIGEYALAISGCDGTMPVVTTPTPPPTINLDPTPTTPAVTSAAPSAPRIRLATSGARGGPVTAVARWAAPVSNGSSAIAGYTVRAERLSSAGRVVKAYTSRLLSAASRTVQLRLARGHYRFRVLAHNRSGPSPLSAPSRTVRAR
jgi:hypothetical protein